MKIENRRTAYETESCVWCRGDKTIKEVYPIHNGTFTGSDEFARFCE